MLSAMLRLIKDIWSVFRRRDVALESEEGRRMLREALGKLPPEELERMQRQLDDLNARDKKPNA